MPQWTQARARASPASYRRTGTLPGQCPRRHA